MNLSKATTNHFITFNLMALIFIFLLSGCHKQNPPIRFGFIGTFSGHRAALSINARNGALLAAEQINADGGINGRKIEFIVQDDQGEPLKAVQVIENLIRQDVTAIVGPVLSKMCRASLPSANKAELVLITPVAPIKAFIGVDDYLFRISPPASETSIATAKFALGRGMRNVAVLYDVSDKIYTEPKYLDFKQAFESGGGRVISGTFTTGKNVPYTTLVTDLVRSQPDCYLLITLPYDTAMLCQHLRMIDATRPIFISPLAYNKDLLESGGKAVEGVILVHSFSYDSLEPAYVRFEQDFKERFKTQPGLWETFGYECVSVLAQALSQNPDPRRLKQTILRIERFKGLQGEIVFDRFGDNRREPLFLTVKDGVFVELK